MITDPVFYELFLTSPETFFLILGLSPEAARETSGRYRYEAIEFKATSQRLDGVFLPRSPDLPVYFVETQFYELQSVYANLLAKAYTYLKQHDPAQPFCAVVLFADRTLEPKGLKPYQALIRAGVLRPFFLDELPELAEAPIGLSIVYLLRQSENEAPARARELIVRSRREIDDEALRSHLIELIETIIIYKFARLSRKEIRAMLHIPDIRETRVFQEGVEVGVEQERERQQKEKLKAIAEMAALKVSPKDIAKILQLDIKVVRKELAKLRN